MPVRLIARCALFLMLFSFIIYLPTFVQLRGQFINHSTNAGFKLPANVAKVVELRANSAGLVPLSFQSRAAGVGKIDIA